MCAEVQLLKLPETGLSPSNTLASSVSGLEESINGSLYVCKVSMCAKVRDFLVTLADSLLLHFDVIVI